MVNKAIRYFLDSEGLPFFWNKIMSSINTELYNNYWVKIMTVVNRELNRLKLYTNDKIQIETDRATTAEQNLSNKIQIETDRATTAEQNLSNKISEILNSFNFCKVILPETGNYFTEASLIKTKLNELYTDNINEIEDKIGIFTLRYKYSFLTIENSLVSITDKNWVQVIKGLVSINEDDKTDFYIDGVNDYNIIQRIHTNDGWQEWEYIYSSDKPSQEPEIKPSILTAEVNENNLQFTNNNASVVEDKLFLIGDNLNIENKNLNIE